MQVKHVEGRIVLNRTYDGEPQTWALTVEEAEQGLLRNRGLELAINEAKTFNRQQVRNRCDALRAELSRLEAQLRGGVV